MIKQRIRWVAALALACVLAVPALASAEAPGATFGLKTGAGVASPDDEGGREHTQFRGDGQAQISADGASLTLSAMTQVEGDGTMTVTPNGDLQRQGRSRVFLGLGTATVEVDGETTTFENVRIAVSVRGHGVRTRLIGKFHGRTGPVVQDGGGTPPDVLRGVIRGRPVADEPAAE